MRGRLSYVRLRAMKMTRSFFFVPSFLMVLAALFAACATSPTGRKQLILFGDQQMSAMGSQSFQEMKSQTPATTDVAALAFVKCITGPVTRAAAETDPEQLGNASWEVVVFNDKQVNAFALPGGKIGVYTGILPVTKTDAQLAAVLGHEVGHVIAHHGAERVSQGIAAQGGLEIINSFVLGKEVAPASRQMIMGGLGLATQVGVLLPYGRTQESEADLIGLNLMARAGFDPRQSVELWKNMAAASGGKAPPEFMSTHPSNESRIANLQAHLPEAIALYNQARASGRAPSCKL